ncbi:hypothetical protein OG230_22835 [Streptomyces sp. NBC_00234]|uniref:hypothetical protein n=1 Tax=Streptomyces sp. NBC_00234 TaxID=2903638 RepID=UPI002E285AC5|nr:hypothetical protein [Streptomyces sp. NBC_00234]
MAATDTMVPTANYDPWCDDGQSDGTVCQTDNADVYYYMDSSGEFELEPVDREMVVNMFTSEYSPTDLVRHYDTNPTFSGDGETDHVWQEGSEGLDSDAIGMAWCDDEAIFSYKCDQHYIRIRGNDTYELSVTCHEMGHAVGLVHGDSTSPKRDMNDHAALGCMVAEDYEDNLGSNNVNAINSTY